MHLKHFLQDLRFYAFVSKDIMALSGASVAVSVFLPNSPHPRSLYNTNISTKNVLTMSISIPIIIPTLPITMPISIPIPIPKRKVWYFRKQN